MISTIAHNLKQLLITIDQFLTVLVFAVLFPKTKSWADETFSARCHRMALDGITLPEKIVDAILFFDKNHCLESYKSELEGRQLPPSLR